MAKISWGIEEMNEAIATQRMICQALEEYSPRIKTAASVISDSGIFDLGATSKQIIESFDLINNTIEKISQKHTLITGTVDNLNVRADEINRDNNAGALQAEIERSNSSTQFKS